MENRVIWMSEDIEAERKRLDEISLNISKAVSNIPPKKPKRNKIKKYKTKLGYREYLKTAWWKFRRKQYWKYHPKKCYCCGGVAEALHHNNYSRLFGEKDSDFVPLCHSCHQEVHDLKKETGKLKYNHKIIKERHNKLTQ